MLTANLILLIAHNGWLWVNTASVLGNTSGRAVAIAVTGMLIVACALLLICVFISLLPRILAAVATIWPEVDEPHASTAHPESLALDDDAVLAAIGFVLHHRLQEQSRISNPNATTTT